MKKTIFTLVLCCIVAMTQQLYAQQEIIKFETKEHDFGTFDEGKVAEYKFVFTNTSGKPVKIQNVQASCGCTTPSWTKDSIPANAKGEIIASYNSEGRPGAFVKTITVTVNGSEYAESYLLTIKGSVNGKVKPTDVNGMIVFEKNSHNFGKVQIGEAVAKTFTFTNKGTHEISIFSLYAACNCVTHKVDKSIIKPNETATLELIYTPNKVGKQTENIMFYTNSTTQPQVMLTIDSEVVEKIKAKSLLQESGD